MRTRRPIQSHTDTACTFCRVIAGDLPSAEVHRDGVCVAFLDIHPINPGQVLVVPCQHAVDLSGLDVEVAGQLMIVAGASPLHCGAARSGAKG